MVGVNPFPPEALAANRGGQLTPAQRHELAVDHKASKRSGWQAGLALCAFGALLVFGAVSGRIESGRIGAFLIGALMLAGGIGLLAVRGATRTTRASGEAAEGRLGLEAIQGDIRRQQVDRSIGDELVGVNRAYHGDNRYQFLIHVGDRRLEVNRAQYEAAPDDGWGTAYLLAGTNRLVNLERVGPSTRESAAIDRAAAMGVHAGGTPPAAATGPVLDGAQLAAAVTGRWANERLRLTMELRADGTLVGPDGTSRWQVAGPGQIWFDEGVMTVTVSTDRLFLQAPDGPVLELHRV